MEDAPYSLKAAVANVFKVMSLVVKKKLKFC